MINDCRQSSALSVLGYLLMWLLCILFCVKFILFHFIWILESIKSLPKYTTQVVYKKWVTLDSQFFFFYDDDFEQILLRVL